MQGNFGVAALLESVCITRIREIAAHMALVLFLAIGRTVCVMSSLSEVAEMLQHATNWWKHYHNA